jgi:hypothetical protein
VLFCVNMDASKKICGEILSADLEAVEPFRKKN